MSNDLANNLLYFIKRDKKKRRKKLRFLSGSYLLLVSLSIGWFIDNEILIYLALRSSKSVSSLKLMLRPSQRTPQQPRAPGWTKFSF